MANGKVGDNPKSITIDQLRGLDVPKPETLKDAELAKNLLPTDLKGGFHEGDIVQIKNGYIQLVATEASCKSNENKPKCGTKGHPYTDGDYHIQVTDKYDLRDSNVIVEIPNPAFIDDPALKTRVTSVRNKLHKALVDGGEFGENCMVHPPRVAITGQLFIDSFHAIQKPGVPGGGRGKQKHPSVTVWELHPVYDIAFLDKKGAGNKPELACPKSSGTKTEWITEED
ncbi:MAG: hypothetical protein JWO13_1575 [Acidobacteriales bacterium]|nr:hypothetical protein [Terriglobales bacterium]